MTVRTAFITAPRPRPTLVESLRSYRAAGFDNDVIVFSDGGDPVIADKVSFLQNETKLGCKSNWIRALSALVNGYPNGNDWLMVCQDDISWAVNAAQDLNVALDSLRGTNALRLAGVISLYTPARVTDKLKTNRGLADGWYYTGVQMGEKTWAAQCYLFSRSMALTLLNDPQFKAFAADPRKTKNIDAIVGKCLNDRGLNVMYYVPSLCDHDLGDANSSLGYPDVRTQLRTKYFRGPRA